MPPQKSRIALIKKSYTATFSSLKNSPALIIPFLIFALLASLSLAVLFLAPRMPFRLLFGPIIKTLWGERFLHYPFNFFLLPKLASLSIMVLTVLIGSLFTGMAVAIVADIHYKKKVSLKSAFNTAIKRYLYLFIVVLLMTVLFYFFSNLIPYAISKYFRAGNARLLFLGPKAWFQVILLAINFALGIFIQSLFVYAIPLLIIEKEKVVRAIAKSIILFKNLCGKTLVLVGLPMLLYIPFMVLLQNSAFLVNNLFPESILIIQFISIAINSLIIDLLVTVSTTYLFIFYKEK